MCPARQCTTRSWSRWTYVQLMQNAPLRLEKRQPVAAGSHWPSMHTVCTHAGYVHACTAPACARPSTRAHPHLVCLTSPLPLLRTWCLTLLPPPPPPPPHSQGEDGAKIEYRVWNPFRSKLAAAIVGGIENVWISPGSKVLYLGAASGTSVSHVSDIVGPVSGTRRVAQRRQACLCVLGGLGGWVDWGVVACAPVPL